MRKEQIIIKLLPSNIKSLDELLMSNISTDVKKSIWLKSMESYKNQ